MKKRYKYTSNDKLVLQCGGSKAKAIEVDIFRVEFQIYSTNIMLCLDCTEAITT